MSEDDEILPHQVLDGDRLRSLLPSEGIDEPTRQVFAQVGDEYGELCDRLFGDDPVFSYGTAEDDELL